MIDGHWFASPEVAPFHQVWDFGGRLVLLPPRSMELVDWLSPSFLNLHADIEELESDPPII